MGIDGDRVSECEMGERGRSVREDGSEGAVGSIDVEPEIELAAECRHFGKGIDGTSTDGAGRADDEEGLIAGGAIVEDGGAKSREVDALSGVGWNPANGVGAEARYVGGFLYPGVSLFRTIQAQAGVIHAEGADIEGGFGLARGEEADDAVCSTDSSTLIMAALGGLLAGYCLPSQFLLLMTRRRKRSIQRALPNTLDLLTICVESGLGLDQAILHVARELGRAHAEMSEELSMINFETRAGKSRPEALHNLAHRTGVQDVKELVAVLIQADRFGTSVAQTLRTYSSHLRIQARQRAEEKAAQLSVKLVFPIFFFILPSLFVITVGPVVVRIVRDLLPMMNSI